MQDVLEFLIELIVELIPLYFGAFLKWIYYGGKKPYSAVLEEKGNVRLGYVSLGIIILTVLLFVKFCLPK